MQTCLCIVETGCTIKVFFFFFKIRLYNNLNVKLLKKKKLNEKTQLPLSTYSLLKKNQKLN